MWLVKNIFKLLVFTILLSHLPVFKKDLIFVPRAEHQDNKIKRSYIRRTIVTLSKRLLERVEHVHSITL